MCNEPHLRTQRVGEILHIDETFVHPRYVLSCSIVLSQTEQKVDHLVGVPPPSAHRPRARPPYEGQDQWRGRSPSGKLGFFSHPPANSLTFSGINGTLIKPYKLKNLKRLGSLYSSPPLFEFEKSRERPWVKRSGAICENCWAMARCNRSKSSTA